jgi:hypothetical protein
LFHICYFAYPFCIKMMILETCNPIIHNNGAVKCFVLFLIVIVLILIWESKLIAA